MRTPDSGSSLPHGKAWRVQTNIVVLMVAFSVMNYFDRTIMSIAGPGIIKEFSLSETEMGGIYTAFLISYALMMIPGGYLVDRFGPRRVLTVMGLGAALFTGLTALGGQPGLGSYLGIVTSFLVIRFGMGMFTAPLYTSCSRMNANWIPSSRRAAVQGFISAGAGTGSALSPILFSWTIAQYGWRNSFWLAAIATAALAVLWLWYARNHPAEHPSLGSENGISKFAGGETGEAPGARVTPWRRLLTDRNLMLLTVSYFTVGYFVYIYFFWIYYYLGEVRGLGPNETAISTTIIFLTWMTLAPLGGWASDSLVKRFGLKTGRRVVPMVGLTLSALLLAVGINLSGTVATVALLSLSFGFAAFSDGPYWAAGIDLGGKQVGAACGILNTGSNLGGLAPLITPIIAAHVSWSWSFYFGCLVLMVGVFLWFFVDPTQTITDGDPVVDEAHPRI